MYQTRSTFQKTLIGSFALCLLIFYIFVPPLKARGAILPLIIAVVAVAAGGAAIYDFNSCGLNVIWGCDNGGGAGAGSGNDGRGINDDNDDDDGDRNGGLNGGLNGAGGNGANGGAGAGQACSSAQNSCGMTSTGFTNAQGQCAATPPPASSCPVPVFGEFSADPDLVRSGDSTSLSWEVSSATACSLSGGGLNLLGIALSDSQSSNPITSRTEFTLTCFNGDAADGAPSTSQTIVVNIIPAYEEI